MTACRPSPTGSSTTSSSATRCSAHRSPTSSRRSSPASRSRRPRSRPTSPSPRSRRRPRCPTGSTEPLGPAVDGPVAGLAPATGPSPARPTCEGSRMSVTDAETTIDTVVAMRGITIQFPGVKALDDVDLHLRAGEVNALMGENGAGKSTLIKALTGEYAVDAGTITVAGEPRVFHGTADAQSAGVSTVYQEVNLCTNLSVGENVMLGHESRRGGRIDWRATHRAAAQHLANLGVEIDTRTALGTHSIAVQQLVAISRAMVTDAKVLVLDEPTSSLDRSEVQQLFSVMRDLRSRGVAILFVTHFLDQVFEIADRCTVLRNGRLVGEHRMDGLSPGSLVSLMLGRNLDDLEALSSAAERHIDRSGTPVVRATGTGRKGIIEPTDVEVYPGE